MNSNFIMLARIFDMMCHGFEELKKDAQALCLSHATCHGSI